MNVKKSGYKKLDWVDALKAKKEPRNYEERVANTKEEDVVDQALPQMMEAVYEVPTGEETSQEAINKKARTIQEESATSRQEENKKFAAERVAQKKRVEMDASREQWKNSWQDKVLEAQHPKIGFDPETSKDGRIMAMPAKEETRGQRSRVPTNANSILDPGRLDRLAAETNAHDDAVKASKDRQQAQIDAKVEEQKSEKSPVYQNEGSRILRSGGADSSEFIQRVPSNQISMTDIDDMSDLSSDERTQKLQQLFVKKVPNRGDETRKANQERREEIQGKRGEKDRSWEKVSPPKKTSDVSQRLMELWIPKKKD